VELLGKIPEVPRRRSEQADAHGGVRRDIVLGALARLRLAAAADVLHVLGEGVVLEVAGAAIAGGIAESHALEGARVVAGELLPLDHHGELGAAVLLAKPLRPEREFAAETFVLAGL